jgi:succinate dehydrogenase / fumarate reductase iron-sulfur subunit
MTATSPHASSHESNGHPHADEPSTFEVRILRQDAPGESSYWERHCVEHEPDMNMTSVLQRIAAKAETADGRAVTPVSYDCNCLEEVCGACTMVINGRVRQACTALVDKLLDDNPSEIELRPMSKFPVIRDLLVSRKRLFQALKKVKAWLPVDGYYDMGGGPRQSPEEQLAAYPLYTCMSCGCCLDACPQYQKIELSRRDGETDEQFAAREQAEFNRGFIGAHAINQVEYYNSHPTGKMQSDDRLAAETSVGGIQDCGNAQNCVAVCPKEIPLTTSIGRQGRAATLYKLRQFFGG